MPGFFQDKNNTPLMRAIEKNDSLKNISKIVTEQKSDIDKTTGDGESALYRAISWGRCDVVKLLLENKADMYAGRMRHMPPLQVAVVLAQKDILLMLLNDFKVDINEQSKGGYIREGSRYIGMGGYKEGDYPISGGYTALMHAVYCRYWDEDSLEILKTLLKFDNIDLNCKNDQGDTAREMAIERNRTGCKIDSYLDCVELIDQAAIRQSKPPVARPGF